MGGGGGGGILGSVGGIVGGLIGQSNASGYASHASSEAGIADSIMQQMAAVPDIQKPLILEQYRQAGILTPAMEKQINLGVSQASQVKANPALQAAQTSALQSMAQRSQQGLTASDRAAFNQLQQQVGSQTQGRLAAIQQQQQAQTGGQGTQGAALASKLLAAQGGANMEAMNADQLAAQASNNALQATAQYGSMAGQQNQQQFSQQMEAAKSADAFRQFDVQNQVAQQQRNTTAQNTAQQANLNLAQNIGNANTSQANQEQYSQLQRQAQEWQMKDTQAVQQAQSAAGYGNTLSGMATQTAQAGANLGAGIGGVASSLFSPGASQTGSFAHGGEIHKALGYAAGGSILDQISPIQLAGMQAASPQQFTQFKMPQRGVMPPINFDQPNTQQKSSPKKQQMGTTDNASGDPSISGNGVSNDVVDGSVVDGGDAYAGADMGASAADAGAAGGGLADLAMLANKGGKIPGDYRQGGKVPGKPIVKGDDPKNDIVPARLSPGEVVLPRSIAMKLKNAPDGDFNEHLNKIVGPFIRKSQAMAKGGEVDCYDDGGQVDSQSPDEAGIEAVARKNAILRAAGLDPSKSDFEYETEAKEQQKRRNESKSNANGRNYDDGGEVDPFSSIDSNSNIDPSHQQTGGEESAADVIAASKKAQTLAPPASYDQYDAKDGSDSASAPNARSSGSSSDGMSSSASASNPIQLAGNSQMQQAAAGDAGASAAPPPRGPMAANTYAGPPQQKSGGGGGSSIMSLLPMLAMLANKGGEVPNYDDGGEVEGSAWNRLIKNLHNEFSSSKSTTESTPDEDHTAEYEKIRKQNRENAGEPMNKGGKVKNALSMLRSINGYAEGTDDVQQDDPNSTPVPDTDDDDQDSAIVRANPDSDTELEKVAQNEFQEDQPAQEDSEELDRSKAPATMEMVKKDGEKESPEEKAQQEKEFEKNFKEGEEQPVDQSIASADDSQKPDLTQEDIDKLDEPGPSSTDDKEQPLKSPEEKLSDLQMQLRRAQAQRYNILQGAQGAKYGALIAAGLAGHGAKPVGAEYFNSDKLSELPVKNIQEQMAMEKDDPSSKVSQFYRERLENSLNMKIDKGVSASGMEKMFPQVTKIVGAEYQLNAKKQMADINQKNKVALQNTKQTWQENQNNLNRDTQLKGHQIMADAMGQRATLPAVTNAVNQVENDPVVKPLRIGQQALSLSKSMLENPDVPVTPALLNDASNGFTQALALRPGAVTQKRYDATKITTLKNQLAAFVAKATDNPDLDMRTYDPALYNTLHNYVNTLHDDYNGRLQGERNRLIQEKSNAYKAAGAGNVSRAVDTLNTTGAAGMAPPTARTPAQVPGQTPGRTVVRKGYNSKTNQTQFIYDDGTKETKPGKL